MEIETRLKNLGTKWLAGCNSVAAVIEKLVVEQPMDILPTDLQIWMCERKPTTGEEAGALADNTLARRRRRSEGQTQEGKKVRLASVSNVDKKATTLQSVTKPNLQLQVAHPWTQTRNRKGDLI